LAVKEDGWRISPYERSRRAPLDFWARADNARFTAYILFKAAELETISAKANDIGYGGSPSIATHEAFVREASLSLELIIKGVIAQRLEVGEKLEVTSVPANHNVPQLWDHAKLPKPSDADYGRLVQARVYLMWASRYLAPTKDEHGERDSDESQRYATERRAGRDRLHGMTSGAFTRSPAIVFGKSGTPTFRRAGIVGQASM
jgi:hypothetical protein